jgi:hypothetical protein
MKKLGLLLIVLILGTGFSMAQDRGQRNFDPEERAKAQTAELKELLDLNKDQEKKVYDLNLKAGKDMAAMREEMQSSGGFNEDMRAKMMEMREKQNQEMKKILSDSQYEKYEKYLEDRRNRRRGGQR